MGKFLMLSRTLNQNAIFIQTQIQSLNEHFKAVVQSDS